MNELTVTTIIPAYNAAHTISRALNSVLTQTQPSCEVLVVDDGSTDDLAETLRPYRGRVTHVRKSNGGASSARNLGIKLAQGDLIAFLDADDYWEPNKLASQIRIFEEHPKVEVTASRYFTQVPGESRYLTPVENEGWFDQVVVAKGDVVFDLMAIFSTITVVVRRRALDGFRFIEGLRTAEDRELWLRLIAAWPVYLDSRPLATCVLEPGSLGRTDIDNDYQNMHNVIQSHKALLTKRGLLAWESNVYRHWAASHLGHGDPERALAPAYQRLRLQPTSLEAWWILMKCYTMRLLQSSRRPADRSGRRISEQPRSVECHHP